MIRRRRRNPRELGPIPPGMPICPIVNRLWIYSLARLELDDWTLQLAFRLLDTTPHRA